VVGVPFALFRTRQYGAVYKATLKRTNDVYALKKVTFQNAEAKADIVQEADILFEAVSNEFVVGYFGRQEQGNEMWVRKRSNGVPNRGWRTSPISTRRCFANVFVFILFDSIAAARCCVLVCGDGRCSSYWSSVASVRCSTS
jgi:hypothetical protein